MPSTTIMAQHAKDIYDRLGEFAMLPYIMRNADQNQPEEDWIQNGQLHLIDGSTINHRKHAYVFSWYQDGEHQSHERPAAMPVNGRPHPSDQTPNQYG